MTYSSSRAGFKTAKTVRRLSTSYTRVCPADLSYRFAGKDDPLLWLPDAVAGLLSEAECRKADRWVAELQRVVPIFEVRRLDAHEPRLPS
jgi:hypothetical protein